MILFQNACKSRRNLGETWARFSVAAAYGQRSGRKREPDCPARVGSVWPGSRPRPGLGEPRLQPCRQSVTAAAPVDSSARRVLCLTAGSRGVHPSWHASRNTLVILILMMRRISRSSSGATRPPDTSRRARCRAGSIRPRQQAKPRCDVRTDDTMPHTSLAHRLRRTGHRPCSVGLIQRTLARPWLGGFPVDPLFAP